MSAMSAMVAVAPGVQAKFGAKSNTVKARRAVVVAAVTEPEAIVADKPKKDKSEFKKKFVKKNVTVQDADIVIGASFPGKVKRVQEYGCFVDFGAKNDGLVHISELTDGFVENVADVVSQDQDVVVYVKSIDSEKGRISLTMKTPPSPEDMAANLEKEQEREAKFQERKTQKKQAEAAMSKLKNIKKGQQIDGVVKSVQPFGAFVEIQDGIEGLVHVTEMSDDYNIEVADFVKEGQTVSVRIIGIDGGKIKLSMKEKLDLKEMVKGIQTESTAGVMEVAFKTKGVTPAQFPGFDALEKAQAAAATAAAAAEAAAAPVKEEAAPEPAAEAVAEVAEAVVEPVAEAVAEPEAAKEEPVATTAAPAPVEATKEAPKQTQKKDETAVPAASTAGITAAQVKSVREKSGAGMMDCKKALGECGGDEEEALVWLRKKGIASADKKASRIAAEGAVGSYIHAGARLGVICEVNCETDFVARGDRFKELVADMAMQIAACPDIEYVSPDDVDPAMVAAEREVQMKMEDMLSKPENIREKIVQGRLDKMVNEKALLKQDFIRDNAKTVEDVIKEVTAELGEKISIRRFVKYTLGEGMEKREEDFAAEVEAQTKALKAESDAKKAEPKEEPKEEEQKEETAKPTIAITAKQVKEVRDKSGAGMMDCKKALGECDGNAEEALIWLRKKGIASADKKASRIAAEGAVGSYIHAGARLGVLVEVNCETDFVARGDRFKALIADMAMQVAACPDIEYISPDDVDPAMVAAEREVQMKMEDMLSKPENIREKIVQGRLDKMVNEKALLKQDFIRDNAKTVEDVIKEATAEIGEKISIRRFTKYKLGEGIEKKNEDFAAEVAAQMGK